MTRPTYLLKCQKDRPTIRATAIIWSGDKTVDGTVMHVARAFYSVRAKLPDAPNLVRWLGVNVDEWAGDHGTLPEQRVWYTLKHELPDSGVLSGPDGVTRQLEEL